MLSLRLILPGSQHYWRLLSAATGVGSHPSLWCDTWGPTFPLCPKESSIQQSPHHSQPSVKGQDPSCPHCPAAELHLTGSRDAWYLHKLQRAHAVLVRPFLPPFRTEKRVTVFGTTRHDDFSAKWYVNGYIG